MYDLGESMLPLLERDVLLGFTLSSCLLSTTASLSDINFEIRSSRESAFASNGGRICPSVARGFCSAATCITVATTGGTLGRLFLAMSMSTGGVILTNGLGGLMAWSALSEREK